MSAITEGILTQLLAQTPMLLAYFAGVVVAAIFWQRARLPSALALVASLGLLLTTVTRTVVFQYLFVKSREWGWESRQLSTVLGLQGLGATILEAAFFAVLLGAVFAARSGAQEDVQPNSAPSAPTGRWSFRGRIGRGSFAVQFLVLVIANIALALATQAVIIAAEGESLPILISILVVNLVFTFFATWLSLAIQIKRWHDLGKSGWMVLLNFTLIAIPVVLIVLACVKGNDGPNRFGGDPLRVAPQLS